jgi:hypothetical protein
MFFANRETGMAPKDCPDNDGHNVDAADSLVTTVPVALFASSEDSAADNVAATVRITRKSPDSEKFARIFSGMLRDVCIKGLDVQPVCTATAKKLGMRLSASGQDPVTA